MQFSKIVEQLSPSATLVITAAAKKLKQEGFNVIDFGIGEPDFDTPENIKTAAIDAINKGFTKYTVASGIIELKKAIVNKFVKNNLHYNIDNIIVSSGAKQCLSNVLQAILNPGDEVIVPFPYWVSYPELIKLYGGVAVFPNSKAETGFKYTLPSLDSVVTEKTKAIILNSPNNPTGSVYTSDELKKIADFAREKDLFIISDEIYESLVYDDKKHVSIASLSQDAFERTIVINGVSKSYSMTGWRIGYAAGNNEIIDLMSSIQSHTTSNPTSIAQYAALEALTGDQSQLKIMVNEFEKRRNFMFDKINGISKLSCIKPEGAFYIMLNISKITNDSTKFSEELLKEEKVAVVPGVAFGQEGYVRLSYATSMENIDLGLNKIENFITRI